MVVAIILALAAAAQSPTVAAPCGDEARILNEDLDTFDQDPQKGWRSVAARPNCRAKAAELMRVYREMLQMRLNSLVWHEGQVLAEMGRATEAIALFQRAKRPNSVLGQSQEGWNAYADATIAFLRRDRIALQQARKRLVAAPIPTTMERLPDGSFRSGSHASQAPNLDVVDGLIKCFDRSYLEAYGSPSCRSSSVPRGIH